MSKKFSVMAIPSFQDNYIWLLHRDGQAVVVDPGDAAPVKAVLLRYAWSLEAILITHHHADHQGGVVDLLAANSFSVPVYGPAREAISACWLYWVVALVSASRLAPYSLSVSAP